MTKEWMEHYTQIKKQLECKIDLDAYFTEQKIGKMKVDVLDIGMLHVPTGVLFACDPMVELCEAQPYLQTIPVGTYPIKICVVPSEQYGDRYACVKVEINNHKPIRYELGVVGNEDLETPLEEDEFFGFGVDAGMGCIADVQTKQAVLTYLQQQLQKEHEFDLYGGLFCQLLEQNAKEHPKYQLEWGNWLNWTIPGTDCNLPMFSSGWGDGVYPCYFGYDQNGEVCGVYILFLDIEECYDESMD